jgi:hypothetical protein
MEEVLEQDLDPQERDQLEERLRYVAEHSDRPDLTRLAEDLLEFLRCESMELAPRRPGPLERAMQRWRQFEEKRVTRRRARMVLAGALLGLSVATLVKTGIALVLLAVLNVMLSTAATSAGADTLLLERVAALEATVPRGLFRYANLALELAVGLLLLFSAGLFVFRKDQLATAFGSVGLLLSLSAVNLLVFYYDQFSSILTALIQLVLLSSVIYYRQKYVAVKEDTAGAG